MMMRKKRTHWSPLWVFMLFSFGLIPKFEMFTFGFCMHSISIVDVVSTNIDLTMIHNSHTDTKRVKLAVKIINKQIAQHITAPFYEYSFTKWEKIFDCFFFYFCVLVLFCWVSFRFALLVHYLLCTNQTCKHTK